MAEKLSDDVDLACEVISLSHRFQVKELTSVAAVVACQSLSIENSIRLDQLFKMYECDEKDAMLELIELELGTVGKLPDFKILSVEDLESVISSTEVVVEEFCLFEIINSWLQNNPKFSGTKEIVRMFSHVHFELLSAGELRFLRSQRGAVPDEVVLNSLRRYTGMSSLQRLPAIDPSFLWNGAIAVPPLMTGFFSIDASGPNSG